MATGTINYTEPLSESLGKEDSDFQVFDPGGLKESTFLRKKDNSGRELKKKLPRERGSFKIFKMLKYRIMLFVTKCYVEDIKKSEEEVSRIEKLFNEPSIIMIHGQLILINSKMILVSNLQKELGDRLLRVANHLRNYLLNEINFYRQKFEELEEDDYEYKIPMRAKLPEPTKIIGWCRKIDEFWKIFGGKMTIPLNSKTMMKKILWMTMRSKKETYMPKGKKD
jgi:hypothetical protein